MGRALKLLFQVAVLAAIGIAGYAFFAELPPPTEEIVIDLPVPENKGG